jgi:two-component system response regulator AlgR
MPAATDRAPLAVMIVDDELFARTRLRSLVQACTEPRCVVAGEAADGVSALQWLRDNPCDVVLLDVAMPGLDGLHLADELQHRPKPPAVVFVTAHGEHALRAFELEATDYLTKPVRRDVDLDVELAELGDEVGVGDAVEHARVRERRIAGVVGEVELDLEPDRAAI